MATNQRTTFSRYIDNENSLILPNSANKYIVTIDGKIFDQQNNLIQINRNESNDIIVFIDWYDGSKYYLLAEIIAHTFKPLAIGFQLWNLIKVLFADNNSQNLHPSNLVWKFPVGLGADIYNGFSFIPMFSRYMINKEGVVFDMKRRQVVCGHFNVGYHSYVLMPDTGKKTSLKRHRGICLAFTDYPNNVDSLDVNHINGVAGDDRFENLEWCTPSENIKHAFKLGLRKAELTPILVRNIRTGKIAEYESIVSCARSLGIKTSLISGRIKTPTSNLNPDGLQFKRKKDITEWYVSDNPEQELQDVSWKKSVLLLNLTTSEITEFPSQREAASFFGFVESVFCKWLGESKQRVYKKDNYYYLAKHVKNKTPWRIVDNPEIDYLTNTLNVKPVLVKNVGSGQVVQYSSATECAKALNILTTTLNYRLSHKGQKMFSDGTQIKYLNEPLPFSEINKDIVSILSAAPYN